MKLRLKAVLASALLLPAPVALAESPAPEKPAQAEALSLIDSQCAADGIPQEACSCHRDVFTEKVIAQASRSDAVRLAAMLQATDAVDQREMMVFVQEAGAETMEEAAQLLVGAKIALEACNDQALAEIEAAKAAEAAEAMPEGDDPRTRFVRQCAAENGQVGVCECVADELLEQLDPIELELMVDLRAADARGKDAIAALAEERGMTVEEAEQALMMMTGRISMAMMSIDPMACAMAAK